MTSEMVEMAAQSVGGPLNRDPSLRIVFVNQLRGIAALCVVASHFFGIFFLYPEVTGSLLHLPALKSVDPPLVSLALGRLPYFGLGPFGVALFFLISGFVVPISLEQLGPVRFLVARFFRIWPTYACGLSTTIMVFFAMHVLTGAEFPITLSGAIINGLIVVRDWMQVPSIDGLVWTLEIEVKFYVLMALLTLGSGHIMIERLIIVSVIFALLNVLFGLTQAQLIAQGGDLYGICYVIGMDGIFFIYMLIGTVGYLTLMGRAPAMAATIIAAGLYGLAEVSWWSGLIGSAHALANFPSYGAALVAFAGSFVLRSWFKTNVILDSMAMISYSLYVSHAILGYAVLYFLSRAGLPGSIAVLMTTALAIGVAVLLHFAVERPSQALGKRLANRLPAFQSTPVSQ